MPIATWYSKSKKKPIPLNEMPMAHLINAYKKCLEGAIYTESGEPMSADEHTELCKAFEAEFTVRNVTIPTYSDDGDEG